MTRRTIITFGDSITQLGFAEGGWVAALAHHYSRKADVLCRGFSGYNTRLASYIVGEVLAPTPTPLLLTTLFFGANDAASPAGHPVETEKPLQHVPLEEYEGRLSAMIEAARAVTDGCVIVITPPPVDRLRWPDRSNASVSRYAAAARRAVASAHTLPGCPVRLVDACGLISGGMDGSALMTPEETVDGEPLPPWCAALSDGLHLSAAGNAALAVAVIAAIPKSAQPDATPLDYPIWRDCPAGVEEAGGSFTEESLQRLRSLPLGWGRLVRR
jgi:lysophospholipase L1-like esterase